ncbi:diguanylate cyclase/phosphodiesterase (GGDEF & EAL domains) with PAS/PAC sensor(s) [hydrothermal vent metagenome]|uniref:cyclic-guanylate-specific phosphodiesterase n=1 Tax=hydrothermal vent metagenome TaxID=652676 RepID=A0A3B0TEP6_9ZZZZ
MRYRLKFTLVVAFSVLVTLGPLVMIDVVVRWVAVEQGRSDFKSMAHTMVSHAENMLDSAVGSLEILSREGMDACSPVNIRRLGEVVFTRAGVKEVGIADAQGRMLCSNYGASFVELGTDLGVAAPGADSLAPALMGAVNLSMVPTRLASRTALGIRRKTDTGSLIAFVEPKAIFLDLLHGHMQDNSHARLELAGGAAIMASGESAEWVREADPDFVEITAASSRYPISVVLSGPRFAFTQPYAEIQGYAKVGSGMLSLAFLILMGFYARNRPSLEGEIDEAMRNGEFVAHYQPIIDVARGRVCGCEALIRWRKPDGKLVSPDLFVPIAEAGGQIMPMTKKLMERVVADLAPMFRQTSDFYVSINLVAEHFEDDKIVRDVRRLFGGSGIGTSSLVFEITERRPLRDIAAARKTVGALQGLGARVALDDAGTGHGGLAYIQGLGMDIIKIDRMFVEAIGTAAVSAPIVDALLELGDQLDMSIIAEGVETEAQFAYLRERGARYIQGYLFSPPLPPQALARFVASFNRAKSVAGKGVDEIVIERTA